MGSSSAASASVGSPSAARAATSGAPTAATGAPASAASAAPASAASSSATASSSSSTSEPTAAHAPTPEQPVGPVTLQQVKDSWPEILEVVKNAKLNAWLVVYTAQPLELRDGKTLVLSFPSQKDVEELKKPATPGQGVGDLLKKAFVEVLGLEPALIARVDASAAPPAPPAAVDEPPIDDVPPPDDFPPTDSQGWAVTAIPYTEPAAPDASFEQGRTKPALNTPAARPTVPTSPADAAGATAAAGTAADSAPTTPAETSQPATSTQASGDSRTAAAAATDSARYGESVVRELLGASFIEEQPVTPRVVPRPEG